jgi:2'-5' RNA ligase
VTEGAGPEPAPDRQDLARLFIAVVPPPEVVMAVTALPRPALPGARYARPEQTHVTLRFLGNAPIDAAVGALAAVQAPAPEAVVGPRTMRLGRQVVCLPVSGLDIVARAVAEATAHVGRPLEMRPFRGHLTVARLARPNAATWRELLDVPFEARFPVNEVLLVRSTLARHGARYDLVATHPLVAGL